KPRRIHMPQTGSVRVADSTPTKSEDQTAVGDSAALAPGQMRVIKRNGTLVPYDETKIVVAITKAFLAVENYAAAAESARVHDTVRNLAADVTATFRRRMPSGGTVHIEEIQDQVELELMRAEEREV